MKKTLLAISATLFTATAGISQAAPSVETFLGMHHTDWDQTHGLEDSFGFDLGAGVDVGKNWALESWYSRDETERESDSIDVIGENLSINALRYLVEGKTRPFVSLGASHYMINPDDSASSSGPTIDLGLGVKHYFDNNVILRGDVIAGRLFEETSDNISVDPTVRLSIGYAFGRSSSPKASTPAPAPARVAAAPKPAPAPNKDSDGDGVFDVNDNCPNTPAKLKVDENGCKVTLTETVKIDLNIQFPNNSDDIPAAYLSEIRSVAEFMQQYEGTVVEVAGYTDDRGSAAYNQQLSEKRAKAVAAKLTSDFGIESNRVKSVGYGEQDPIADNNTAEGRAQNRRVVAEISTRVETTLTK